MLTLSTRNQFLIGFGLVMLITLTRNQHFSTLTHLPGASWAMFFLAGVYLRSAWVLPILLAWTWFVDFAAFTWGGASGYCLTPAYAFLLPAYSTLWLAGAWYAKRVRFSLYTLLPLVGSVLLAAVFCELFSSGGFYFFSGRFTELSIAQFSARELQYFPPYLLAMLFYVGIAAVIHTLFGLANRTSRPGDANVG